MKARTVTITASALLVVFFVGSILALRGVDEARPNATLQDVLFISSPKVVNRLALGYNGLLADIYWTRAVQYFGSRHARRASQYNLLAPLLEITTTLDPHLLVAYQFGANFLAPAPPYGAGMSEQAIKLIDYGIVHNPDDWHLYYQLGFIYYMDLKDYPKAADAFERGSRVPNAHPFLTILAAQMAQHAGDTQMARALWTTTYESTQDKMVRSNAVAHLRALQVDDDVTYLEKLVSDYRSKTGRLPDSLTELVSQGLLRGIPRDPTGRPYKITSDGRVEVEAPDQIPFLDKGVPPGYKPPPPKDLEKLLE